ncbi:MAG: outer membrane lipoprotein carrier protein LolA [Elusimicrobiota bacterium]|jgi:outer membrane lipoprotein carrier protein|nr:outer membrane lipoprotein carrier protein LolA [Elusimicrobiota bacterium]
MKKIFFIIISMFFAASLFAANYSAFSEVKTISSDFIMQRYVSIAKKPLTSLGKFYFERPGFLRWEYTKPFAHGILLDGKKAYSWKQIGDKKETQDISKQSFAKIMAKQIYIFVSMETEEISKIYNIEERADGIDLLPKDNSDKQTVKRIKLFFNKNKNAVVRVEIYDKSGDKTIISFTNTLLNHATPPNVLKP